MDTEEFESFMLVLVKAGLGANAVALRARDTAQREALSRVEAERDRLGSEVNQLSKRLCICHECGGRGEVHTGEYTNEGQWQPPEPVMVECGECGGDGQIGQVTDLDATMAKLAEARELMRETERVLRIGDGYGWEDRLATQLGDFLTRHAQAEKQEALSDAELMDVAMFVGSGNKAARRANAMGAAELPAHLVPRQQESQSGRDDDYVPEELLKPGVLAKEVDRGVIKSEQQEAQGAQAGEWKFCPECGSSEVSNFEGKHKQCANCGQEWFSDIDYSDVVQKHLSKHYLDKDAVIADLRAALATQPAAGEPLGTWIALTAAGQLRKGDKIRFRFGQETLTETVALVLDAGTEREEIVYNRKRNFYFITSKALAGTSSAKEVEVLRTVAAAHEDEAVRNIESAAMTLAACMDYPWEHMTEQGRKEMRKHARRIIDAAMRAQAGEVHGNSHTPAQGDGEVR